jgi:hypothetical protein
MWSLGCIFLEIWTVLKGETVANLHAFLDANGAFSSCYHLNSDSTLHWMINLKLRSTSADNSPQDWIRHLLVEDKGKRWTARELLSEIETVNSNPEAKFAFSGQCCMEELGSAESVISSNGSFYKNGASSPVPQPPLHVAPLAPMSDKEELWKAPAGATTLNHNITPSGLNDSTSNSSMIEPQPRSTKVVEDRIMMQSALEGALGGIPKDEAGVLVVVDEFLEINLYGGRSGESTLDSDGTLLKGQIGDLDRAQSTNPEISLASLPNVEPSSISITQRDTVEHASLSLNASRDIVTGFSSQEAVNPAIEIEKARSVDLDEKSNVDANEDAEQISDPSSLTVERTTTASTSGKDHDSEPRDVKTENPDISIDPQWLLKQPATLRKIGSSLPPLPFRPAAPFFALSNYEDPQCPQPTKITSTDLVPYSLPATPRANSRRAVERRFSTRLKSFLAVGRTKRGITDVVSFQTFSMSDPAHSRVDTIHNYWNVTLKNESSEFFIKREPPRYKGLEVAQDVVEASMNQTSELMTKILSVVMIFEKSCDISISDMLLHTGNSDLV